MTHPWEKTGIRLPSTYHKTQLNVQLPWAPESHMFRGFHGKITWVLGGQHLYFHGFGWPMVDIPHHE